MQLQAFENVPYYPLGLAQSADRVPQGHHRRAGGLPDLLERAPHLIAGSAPATSPVIVIFGAAVRPGGRPSGTLLLRVESAVAFGARFAEPLFVPTGGVGPIRTVGGIGDGGNAGSARRPAGAHPAGGNRHRHAVLGACGRGTAADRVASRRRCSSPPAFTISRAVCWCCGCWAFVRALPPRLCCRPRRAGGAAATGGCARSRRFPTTRYSPCGGGFGVQAAASAPSRRNPAPPRSPGRSRPRRPPDRPCPR